MILGLLDIKGTEQIRRVYSVNGLAPTLSTMQGGNRQPKILEPYCINLYKEDGTETSFQDRVYDTEHISPAITTSFRPSYIVAMRGRYLEHPTDRTLGLHTEQRLEPNMDGLCNIITTVQKDNLVMETVKKEGDQVPMVNEYRIRKLTPKECFRLMDVSDENADKMLAVNSSSQCYKQAGNSIVVACLVGIFSQLNIKGVKTWNEGLYKDLGYGA